MKQEDDLEEQRKLVKQAKRNKKAKPYRCAKEGGNCKCDGRVRYGKYKQNGVTLNRKTMRKFPFKGKMVTGSIKCSNAGFGGDPTPGQAKQCFCNPKLVTPDVKKAIEDKKKKTKQVIQAIEQTKKANKQVMQAKKLIAQLEKKMQAVILKLVNAQKKVDTVIKEKLKE